MSLKDKKILFIAPKLFGIPESITETLIQMGAHVDYYDERPNNSFLVKALIRINRNLIGKYVNRYHSKILSQTIGNKYDYIFFIKGESISVSNLRKLKDQHPESSIIVYHWDSIANNNNALNLLKLFDKCFSFDRRDCENFGITFLPLFYYDKYSNLEYKSPNFKYDLLFVGTAHSDRYKIIKSVTNQFAALGGKSYLYFFFQGRIMFYKYLLQNKQARDINRNNVHFESISKDRLFRLYEESKIIIDVNHPKQTGLTLRCIETLGSHRKLITTNKDILNYDFYNSNNICVINRENPEITKEFIETPYVDIPNDIYLKYSLSNWLITIFSK